MKPFHKEWIDILNNYDRIAISSFTGSGKTTIFGIAYPLWISFYKPNSVSLIISRSIRTQSANVLEEIKNTIENNEILKQLMPTDIKVSWTKEKVVMNNLSKIQYSSYSINVKGIQADYEFCDEVASYPDHELFFRDVATRVIAKNGKLACVSTPVHSEDLLAILMHPNRGYFSKVYPAIKEGQPIWAEKFPIEKFALERIRLGDSNFEKNYMCNPKGEAENSIFTISAIESCFDISRDFSLTNEGGEIILSGDFAVASGPTADFDCYTVIERIGEKCILKWGERHRGMPVASKIMRLNQLYDIYKPSKIILDESGIGASIIQDLRAAGLPVESQSFHSAARIKLLMDLKRLIDSKNLIIPYSPNDPIAIAYANKLEEELSGMKETKSKITQILQYESKAAHDDTVMSLSMACKGTSRLKPFTDSIIVVDEKNIKQDELETEEAIQTGEATWQPIKTW
jgi:hypothetical protein